MYVKTEVKFGKNNSSHYDFINNNRPLVKVPVH